MVAYFELSWGILSTICTANVLFGILVINILTLNRLTIIPVIISAAGAVANGLCYYVSYADNPVKNTTVASAFGDILWMVQEAGNSFYSYMILSRIIFDSELKVFKCLFWSFISTTVVTRILIAICRAQSIVNRSLSLQSKINGLHVGYFTSLALLECVSAFFLLRKFASVKRASLQASLRPTVFQHLMRNSEVRVATLALMGTTRAITYYFQPTVQSATSVPSQIDRFVYTFECLFPVVMFIDVLATKLASAQSCQEARSFPRQRNIEDGHQQRTRQQLNHGIGHTTYPWEEEAPGAGSNAVTGPLKDVDLEKLPEARRPSRVLHLEDVGVDRV